MLKKEGYAIKSMWLKGANMGSKVGQEWQYHWALMGANTTPKPSDFKDKTASDNLLIINDIVVVNNSQNDPLLKYKPCV